jgi:general secretion pathway protein A
MYHEFYQLDALPFENTPDPRFFYATEQHQEALAALEFAIRVRSGFALVTGDIGSGKTMIGRSLLDRCADRATFIVLLHGHDDGLGLLRHMLRSLGVRLRRNDDHALLLERLRARLSDQAHQERPVVVLADEAQTFSNSALEELRLLSNFDTPRDKMVQVVLIGEPELRDRLRHPRLAALRQRIVLTKQLRPLNPIETAGYIAHRLRTASKDPEHVQASFDGAAISEVFRFTKGIPRLINIACDSSLLAGFVRGAREITGPIVRRGIQDVAPGLADATWTPAEIKPALSLTGTI